jgi:hypothetical protein
MNPVLSAAQVHDLAPGFRAKLLVAYLAMVSNMNILFLPGRLVVLIVARPNPKIGEPFINVLSFKSAFDFEPAVNQEVLCFLVGQACVRFRIGEWILDISTRPRRGILDHKRLSSGISQMRGLDRSIRILDKLASAALFPAKWGTDSGKMGYE